MDTFALSLALVAGAVAAFNPCGFALLPAYLTVLVVDEPPGSPRSMSGYLVRAGTFSLGMTAGFVVVFGAFGAVVAPLKLSIERYLPVVTLLMGVLLVVVGAMALSGRTLAIPGLIGRGSGPTASWRSQVQYGITFALASLSCTIGPFLAVTSGSLAGTGAAGVLAAFVTYAVGMGTVVFALALTTILVSTSISAHLRSAVPVIARMGGLLLLAAGAYVAWYGWFELRGLAGGAVDDPVISTALDLQSALTRTVAAAGAIAVILVLVVLVLITVGAVWRARAKRDQRVPSAPD